MDASAKQQIIEKVKSSTNVLVTVSNNPSVDQLAACIGLTLLLNKMDKHATAVFSGQVPSTIEFLKPEETFESNTDSLQDFIISLDKSKADKLRYKVEDNVVKIFITPYRTKIGQDDLVFEYGDFNVELVLALGVIQKEQLDATITSHGRILHDATVVCINAGESPKSELGQINWNDPAASGLSEMIVSISEAFGSGLIDNQIATAFLTGIVSQTERFRNAKTSPKVMTMSAQLMAAGANQQLIASNLEMPAEMPITESAAAEVEDNHPLDDSPNHDGTLSIEHNFDDSPVYDDQNNVYNEPQPPEIPQEPLTEPPHQQESAPQPESPQIAVEPMPAPNQFPHVDIKNAPPQFGGSNKINDNGSNLENHKTKRIEPPSAKSSRGPLISGVPTMGGALNSLALPGQAEEATTDPFSQPIGGEPMLKRGNDQQVDDNAIKSGNDASTPAPSGSINPIDRIAKLDILADVDDHKDANLAKMEKEVHDLLGVQETAAPKHTQGPLSTDTSRSAEDGARAKLTSPASSTAPAAEAPPAHTAAKPKPGAVAPELSLPGLVPGGAQTPPTIEQLSSTKAPLDFNLPPQPQTEVAQDDSLKAPPFPPPLPEIKPFNPSANGNGQ